MDIKQNINKIHFNLSSEFETYIKENSSKKLGNFFEILIKESSDIKIVIPFKNLTNGDKLNWFYFANPMDGDSDLIPRESKLDDINEHIKDILKNDRFSEDYKKLRK